MSERLTPAKQREKERRDERLARALRENLKRRKAQLRNRRRAEAQGKAEPSGGTAG